jgi:hypothetical protein
MPRTNENRDIIYGPNGPMHAYTMKIISALVEYAKIMNMRRIQIISQRSSSMMLNKINTRLGIHHNAFSSRGASSTMIEDNFQLGMHKNIFVSMDLNHSSKSSIVC